jgi:hypothetical protein
VYPNVFHSDSLAGKEYGMIHQGTLIEGEGTEQLTSLLR